MTNEILSNVWPEWEIVGDPIGRGTYGVVYKAVRHDHGVDSEAAVKVISIPQDESELDSLRAEGLTESASRTYLEGIVKDFVNEIRLMQSFKGTQNIVSVEDYKVVEKTDRIGWDVYIRMELLTPFNRYISDRALTEEEVIKLGIDICSALELCAEKNIIHRDIKPENIFVNAFGAYKLGDFGVARSLENVTRSLTMAGTYNYMAPEVEKGLRYDATVDVYSLGLVLYRLLNRNRLPFLDTEKQILNPNERAAAARRRMRGETLPAPCDASPAMSEIILCACAYEPERRFTSATAMKKALMNVGKLDDTVVVPPPPGNENKTPPQVPDKKSVLVPVLLVLCALCVLALAAVGLLALSDRNADKDAVEPEAEKIEDTVPAEEAESENDSIAVGHIVDDVQLPPSAPAHFSAVKYDQDSAQLSWDESADTDRYEVQYYSPKKEAWVDDPNYSSGTSYISYGLNAYLSYEFRVRAVNEAGSSPWVECSINTDPGLPAAPTNFRAERNDQFSALLSWNGSSRADYYEAQYYSWTQNQWVKSADYSSGTSYISYGLSSHAIYKFRVRAVNIAGSSQWVECEYTRVRSAPPAPINFRGEAYDRSSASLSWTESADSNDYNDPDYYEVQYYSQKNGEWKDDPDYSSGTSYTSTGLNSYLSYQYRVRAVNAVGSSSWVTCTVYFDKNPPSAPTNLTVNESGQGSAYVSWSSASGADWYEVQYYSPKNEMWKDDPDYSSGTSYTSTGLNSYDSYEYRVRSCNAAGDSDWVYYTYYIFSEDDFYEEETVDPFG